jgi:hypothetical protein
VLRRNKHQSQISNTATIFLDSKKKTKQKQALIQMNVHIQGEYIDENKKKIERRVVQLTTVINYIERREREREREREHTN